MEAVHFSIRVSKALHYKLRYIAKKEDRSISGQIKYLICQCVADYEKENSKIIFEEK